MKVLVVETRTSTPTNQLVVGVTLTANIGSAKTRSDESVPLVLTVRFCPRTLTEPAHVLMNPHNDLTVVEKAIRTEAVGAKVGTQNLETRVAVVAQQFWVWRRWWGDILVLLADALERPVL
jgi:hypothetical protein